MSELLAKSDLQSTDQKSRIGPKVVGGAIALSLLLLVLMSPPSEIATDLPSAHQNHELADSINLFEDALMQINSDYINEIPPEELVEAALKGIFSELDSHSIYLNESSYQKLIEQTDGEYLGVGIEIEEQDAKFFISDLTVDSPAAKLGLKTGDQIIAINGQNLENSSYKDVYQLMQDNTAPTVALNLKRSNKNFDVQLTRQFLEIESVESLFIPHAQVLDKSKGSDLSDQGIAYTRISHFNEYTANDLKTELETLYTTHPSLYGLIIDLRNNPGGLVHAAVEVADLFLQKGTIVSANGRADDADFKFQANPDIIFADLPIVVLINGSSASAAEIVAAALKDQDRATLVGKNTFGKGLVQTIIPIQSGALKLTTSRYYTPSGLSINERGVRPHIKSPDSEMLMAIAEIETSKNNVLPHYMAIKDPTLLRGWQYLNSVSSRDQIALDTPHEK